MSQLRVALVCPDDRSRMAAARAFDAAPPEWDVKLHRDRPAHADAVVAVGCDLPDAVLFDPAHPGRAIDGVKERLAAPDRRAVAVVGASGGCGATSLAIHLAASSAGACLVAAGPAERLAYRLGIAPDAISSAPIPVPGGFKVAHWVDGEPTELTKGLGDRYRSILVDGDRSALGSLVEHSDACVLVLSPTVPSARSAAALLNVFPESPWVVVTNRLGPGGETGSAELQRILGRRISLQLPCSRALRDAEGEGRLASPWTPWRRRVERLARALELP